MRKTKRSYKTLINSIGNLLETARQNAFHAVNTLLVKTYWEIGRHIVVYEQENKLKAEYGSKLLDDIASDLKKLYGKGFSRSNIFNFRRFYLAYQKIQTVSGFLSWSHIVALLSLEDTLARSFYEKECIACRWSVRELDRQVNSMLFERLALSKNKKGILKLASKGHKIEKPEDIVKNPYVLEFLGISEDYRYSERELEQKIINNMQKFLLELGKGFYFVARQYRITLDNRHFYVDLVFYNKTLKCFVLIDLKLGKITPKDIGQMNMYLSYFKKEEMADGDNSPIGIVLGTRQNQILVEYALGGISNKLFTSKYRLSLPSKDSLQKEVKRIVEHIS
ncbi:MAG: PDDEXK nuclease domain-containing protein [Candidatus Saganbacteria bacterium]|nr:PDDEXK nuclease domain-containing protein [Candidatus Saganbacteria bacterium]